MAEKYFIRGLFLIVIQVFLFSVSLFAQTKDSIWDGYISEYDTLLGSEKFDEALSVISKGRNYLENKYPGDPRIGLAYLYLGFVYFSKSDWELAYEPYKNALNVFLNYYKKENYNSAIARAAIGSVCFNLNMLDEAKSECSKAEKIFYKLNLSKDKRLISNYVNLSNIYERKGNIGSAIAYMQKSIDYSLQNFGESFNQLSFYYQRLGFLQDVDGIYSESEQNLLKSLQLANKKGNKSDILKAYYYLGMLYQDMKQHNLSKKYLISSLRLLDSSNIDLSTRKINELNIYKELGTVYREQNQLDSAFYYLYKGESLIDKMDKKDPFTTGLLYDELGKIYLSQNKFSNASYYFQKSILAFSDNLPKVKRQRAETYIHLAHLYEKKKDKDSTTYYYSQAEQLLGIPNYKEYREFVLLTNKADSLYKIENYKQAVVDYKKAIEYGLKVFTGNNDELATTYYRLGLNLGKEKKYHEAIDNMWKAHNMWENLTDSRNPGCMKALNHLYDYYYEVGQKDKAEEVEQRIKVIMEIEK